MRQDLIGYMERHEQMLALSKYLPHWMGVRRRVRRKLVIQLGIIYQLIMLQYGEVQPQTVLRKPEKPAPKKDAGYWLPDGISPAKK